MIPYARQSIDQSDIDAVIEVLQSDFLTQGPQVPLFEEALCKHSNSRFSLALNSGTSALHLACLALSVGPGDTLWTSPITYVASANCAFYCGADVDFVDIDPISFNISVVELRKKLRIARKNHSLPKVLVAVHMAGNPCVMQEIKILSDEFGFKIIEDASHALGGVYKNEPIGSCRYSDITVYSFHPVKIITTAEGGAALTNDSDLYQDMALRRSHGITRDESLMHGEKHGPWHYQQIELGYNYRMTEIQAALGISQLKRLSEFMRSRAHIVKRYSELLKGLPLRLPEPLEGSSSAWHLYIVRLMKNESKLSHLQLFHALHEQGVIVNLHYMPIYLQPYFNSRLKTPIDCPEADSYYSEAISLPMFASMTDQEVETVAEVLHKILRV